MLIRLPLVLLLVVAVSTALHAADPGGRKAFVITWENQEVVLKRTLYSIVYDERSRFLPIVKRDGKVSGLTVVTPSDTYYLFESRREEEDDVIDRDPNRVITTLKTQYRRSEHLDGGNVQDVQPVMLARYEPGITLIVRHVQFERDQVRLFLHFKDGNDLATTVTVKWPVPFSKGLTEAPDIDGLLAKYIARR